MNHDFYSYRNFFSIKHKNAIDIYLYRLITLVKLMKFNIILNLTRVENQSFERYDMIDRRSSNQFSLGFPARSRSAFQSVIAHRYLGRKISRSPYKAAWVDVRIEGSVHSSPSGDDLYEFIHEITL